MTASDPGARRRSLTDDLLADLEQGVPRTPTPSASPTLSPTPPPAIPAAPAPSASGASQTPTVELRITPRSWSSAGVSALPDGGGVAVSLGPLRVSLWRHRG